METVDEKSIRDVIEAFGEAWSRGNAKEAASFFAEDAVRVGASGIVLRGKAEIEALYDKMLNTKMKGASVKYERGSIRMLSPELAVWQGGTVAVTAGGGPSVQGYEVDVLKKVDGRWLIIEGHPKILPQQNEYRNEFR